MATWRRLKPYFSTEPFLLCYVLVYGAHFTILPQLIVSKICSQYYNTTVCNNLHLYKAEETRVYKDATVWNTITFICLYVPSLIFILPMGSLADLIPKKKVLLVTPLALMLQSIIYLMSAKFEGSHLAFLALGSSLAGIFGDYQGAGALANSFMVEMTTAGSMRTVRMTIITGICYTGIGLGAYIAGLLRGKYNFVSVFIFSLIASILNLAYIIIVLPSTKKLHDIEEDGNFSASTVIIYTSGEATTMKLGMKCTRIGSAPRTENEMNANASDVKTEEATKATSDYFINAYKVARTTGETTDEGIKSEKLKNTTNDYIKFQKVTTTGWAAKDTAGTTKKKLTKTLASLVKVIAQSLHKIGGFIRKYRTLPDGKFIWLFMAVYACLCCAVQGESYIIVLFAKHSPLSLSSVQLGTYLLLLFQIRGIGAIFLGLLAKRLKANDILIVILGFISCISTYISMALSATKDQLYYSSLFSMSYGLTGAGLRVLMTKKVDTDEAGTVLSMCGFIGMCADIIMAVTANGVFGMTANFFPGLSILCLAIGSILGLTILLVTVYLERKAGSKGYEDLDHYPIKGQRCSS